jgi:hypothetical protein
MIEIEEQALEIILDQKEAAENRCLELELTVGLAHKLPLQRDGGDGESYRIFRPQWISFVHLCILMGHPSHFDLSPSLDLGRSDHLRCRLPQEEVEWLNTRIIGIFGGLKLILTVPVLPHPELIDCQFSEHGYGDIYTPVKGLDVVIQEVDIHKFPNNPKWSPPLRVAWGTMTAYECLSSTFVYIPSQGLGCQTVSTSFNHSPPYQGQLFNPIPTTPSFPIGRYDIHTMQGACPF